MSAIDATAPELTDPELISRVREGDVGAYGTLFSRHVDAATRLARLLVGPSDADDLVSEGFVKVLNVLLGGGGPDVAFRAYLLTAIRRLHIDKVRGQQKLTTAGDMTPYDPGVPFTDTAIAGFEGGAAAKAFASLPERWQMVLWHLEVENQKPADIAPLLGMSANSVSALAYRAREGLRQAFLTMHAGDLVSDACREANDLMGGYVRHALSRRDSAKVEDHLDHCRRCTAVYLELDEVNSSLAGLLGPVLLGGAAAGYLGGGAAVGVGAGLGVGAAVGRIRDLALSNLPATAAATVTAVGIASITAIAIVNRGPSESPAAAEPPSGAGVADSSTPTPGDSSSPSANSRLSGPTPAQVTPTTSSAEQLLANAGAAAGTLSGTTTTDTGTTDNGDGSGNAGDGNGKGGNNGNGDGNGTGPGHGTGGPPTKPPSGENPSEPPASEPPSEPPSSEPPTEPLSADVALDVGAGSYGTSGHFHVNVHVSGVPTGATVTLYATTSTGDLHTHAGAACKGSGNSFVCTVTDARIDFLFGILNQSRPTLSFTVTSAEGYTDPNKDNNTANVPVPPRRR
jgi:RNA polymerase sigma factor (sigma-70 family)